jgi:hypothetical protein
MAGDRARDRKSKQEPRRAAMPRPAKRPGANLDRSDEGVIEAGRPQQRPAPPDAPPDRRTTDSRRRS